MTNRQRMRNLRHWRPGTLGVVAAAGAIVAFLIMPSLTSLMSAQAPAQQSGTAQ
jgi:hypothetical protein